LAGDLNITKHVDRQIQEFANTHYRAFDFLEPPHPFVSRT